MSFGEQYRGAFFGIERAAAAVLRREFKGPQRLRLTGLYTCLAELRNDQRFDGQEHSFEMSRGAIAAFIAIDRKTLDRGVRELERVGLVEVVRTRRESGLNRANRWILPMPSEVGTPVSLPPRMSPPVGTPLSPNYSRSIGDKKTARRVFDVVSQRLLLVEDGEPEQPAQAVGAPVWDDADSGDATPVHAHGRRVSEAIA